MRKLFLIIISIVIFTGCENQINYYEKQDEKISNEIKNNTNSQTITNNKNNDNSDSIITNDNQLEEPLYYIFEEYIDQDSNEVTGTYIGKGTNEDGSEYIKIKSTVGDKELWSYQTESFFITDTFTTSSVDVYLSYFSPYYGYDFNQEEINWYYHLYIKENNIIKLFNLQNGEVIWTSDELEIMPTSIIETQDHLYVLNDEYPYVYVIDINNGRLVNKIKINNSGFYFIKEIIHNKLMIETHYESPIIEEIDLDKYSNIYTEYVTVSPSYFGE